MFTKQTKRRRYLETLEPVTMIKMSILLRELSSNTAPTISSKIETSVELLTR
jgi:hypothetical protein